MRHAKPDQSGVIFRAVVTTKYTRADGLVSITMQAFGPYSRKSDATNAVSRKTARHKWQGDTVQVTGRVEQSAVIWIPAE